MRLPVVAFKNVYEEPIGAKRDRKRGGYLLWYPIVGKGLIIAQCVLVAQMKIAKRQLAAAANADVPWLISDPASTEGPAAGNRLSLCSAAFPVPLHGH